MLVNLSGRNEPAAFGSRADDWSIYEITLEDETPSPLTIRSLADLERFKATYLRMLSSIREANPSATELHLLAAVPAPVAICLGMLRLPKVDPKLLVYDRDSRSTELNVALTI